MDLATLPPHVLAKTYKDFDYDQIVDLCLVSQQFKQRLCDDDIFWQELFNLNFPKEKVDKKWLTWKQYYNFKKGYNFLDKVSWSIGGKIELYDDEKEISDPQIILNYLKNYEIPWTTDENGLVSIDLDEDTEGNHIYRQFNPEEVKTAWDFMIFLNNYYEEESELTQEDVENLYLTEFSRKEFYKNKFEREDRARRIITLPKEREENLMMARSYDKRQIKDLRNNINEKGYVSRGIIRRRFNNHIYFEGIYLVPKNFGKYYISFGS